MVTRITGGDHAPAIRGLSGLQNLEKEAARTVLTELATQIDGKSGVLKLMHTSKDRDMTFERKGGARFLARRDSKMDATAQAIRSLYERAGLSLQARAQLDTYLSAHRNRVGGSELAALFREHLNPVPSPNPSGLSDDSIKRILPRPAEDVGASMRAKVFGSQRERTELSDLARTELGLLKHSPEVNTEYSIGAPADADRLQCLTVSAKAGQQALDTTHPVVLFLGGSHSRSEPYVSDFAGEVGPHYAGGLNLLSINYRGFGDSAPIDVTPRTVIDDGLRAFRHLRDLGFPPEKIIVRGYSLGAAVAARIHAEAEWRGERLGGVIYDRPMASAAEVARAESRLGPIAGAVTLRSVGHFGAESSLARLPRRDPAEAPRTPVQVVIDNSQHGPLGQALANRYGLPVTATEADHDEHQRANQVLREFLTERCQN
jgi:pimeloyl-ACP methyl ester carboxylesterase